MGEASERTLSVVVVGKTDAQLADELRRDLALHIDPICHLIDRAKASGLTVNFNIAPDPYGRSCATIHIVKAL